MGFACAISVINRSIKGRSGKRVFTDEERKRYACINRGEGNKAAKLTEKHVLHIKSLRGKYTRNKIAEMFGVSLSCIKDIFAGKTWTHLKGNI